MTSMMFVVALAALVSLPYALELYFNGPRDSERDEEYIPDGR